MGTLYQNWRVTKDLPGYEAAAPGQIYNIDGSKMHLYTGGEGDVTVVLAAGFGTANPYADYYGLYEGLSSFARFAVYDRQGYGFSEITSRPRDIDTMVEEVHSLLQQAGQKPPYIWIAHSVGSLEALRYSQKYPEEVKGIVLIDPDSPEHYESGPSITLIARIQQGMIKTGLARLVFQNDSFVDSLNSDRNALRLLPPDIRELDKEATLIKGINKNMIHEAQSTRTNARTVIAGLKPLPIPVTLLTSGSAAQADAVAMNRDEVWKQWSTTFQRIYVENAKHYIHQFNPEIVVQSVKDFIK